MIFVIVLYSVLYLIGHQNHSMSVDGWQMLLRLLSCKCVPNEFLIPHYGLLQIAGVDMLMVRVGD